MKSLLLLLRPHHWVKNLFVFLPAFFSGAMADAATLWASLAAFLAFSLAASSIYCFNDISDRRDDALHPTKCRRPIAAGRVSVAQGYALMLLCLALAMALAFTPLRGDGGGFVIAAYYVMDLAYCRWLKRYALLDVTLLAAGFVLRILAGSAATGIVPSHWIVLMTFLLTLLMGLAKRRDDVLQYEATGVAPRHNTRRYSLAFINQAVTVLAAVTLVCYVMYTLSPEVTARTSPYLYLTTILVLLGLLRYMQLTATPTGSADPTHVLYHDRPLQAIVAAWLLAFLLILY